MRCSEQTMNASDGTELFVRHYTTPKTAAPRTLVIVHGASEHGGRYQHVAADFVERNWNVVAADLRGHGRSGGARTHVRSFQRYVTDVSTVIEGLRLPANQTALLGHSMGGLVAIRYAQQFASQIACVVAMSPLLGLSVPIPRSTLAVGKMLSLVAPRWRFRSRVDPYDTTRCPLALQRRFEDPLINRSVTAKWFFQMKQALRAAWRNADKLTLPLLVMQAGQDRVVDPDVVEPWLTTVGSTDIRYEHLDESLHELLNEPDWRNTTSIIAEWLHSRVSTLVEPTECDSAA